MRVDDNLMLTEGASASANFNEGRIEIDICLEGPSQVEIQKLTLLWRRWLLTLRDAPPALDELA